MTKLIVIIPAYNEEKTIGRVITEIPRQIQGISEVLVLVSDDGSTDHTVEEARASGADFVISHPNAGLAFNFKIALEEALKSDADIIVNIDADAQYNSQEIPCLVRPILQNRAEIVLGDRQVAKLKHMPFGNKYGNILGSWFIRRLLNLNIIDASTGFRAFSREAALRLSVMTRHTYTHETLIQAADQGLKMVQIPIEFRRRAGHSRLISNLRSHIVKTGLTIIRTFTVYKPLRVMLSLGLILFLVGFAFIVRFFYFWIVAEGQGHIQSLIIASVFMMIGFQTIVLGLVASAIGWSRKMMEEILYRIKKQEFKF
ncbi:MAG: glycosyltransferase family 2 protein [Patescibacteria group bacterium]|nr:glycosyltransferase family 2 protein [Patescibacteria group bacterium]